MNQLSEREVLLRNDRMLDPKLRFTADMTDAERNAISRDYYLRLAAAQQEAYAASATSSAGAAAAAAALGPAEDDKLPYGWRQRTANHDDAALVRREVKAPSEAKHEGGDRTSSSAVPAAPAPASSAAAAAATAGPAAAAPSSSAAVATSSASTAPAAGGGISLQALLPMVQQTGEQIAEATATVTRTRKAMTELEGSLPSWATAPEYLALQRDLEHARACLTQLQQKELLLLGMMARQ